MFLEYTVCNIKHDLGGEGNTYRSTIRGDYCVQVPTGLQVDG